MPLLLILSQRNFDSYTANGTYSITAADTGSACYRNNLCTVPYNEALAPYYVLFAAAGSSKGTVTLEYFLDEGAYTSSCSSAATGAPSQTVVVASTTLNSIGATTSNSIANSIGATTANSIGATATSSQGASSTMASADTLSSSSGTTTTVDAVAALLLAAMWCGHVARHNAD